MPALAAQFVEAVGEGGLKPLHAGHEVARRGFDSQVVVVAHDHKGVKPPAGAFAGDEQAVLERLPRAHRLEYKGPVVPAIDHVVDRPGEFQPQLPRHASQSGRRIRPVKVKGKA